MYHYINYIFVNDLMIILYQYYFINLLYYWYHWILHQEWSGILYHQHYICHHKKDYPLKNLRKYEYIEMNGGDIIFGIPVILLILINYYLFTFRIFMYFTINILTIAIMGEVFHSSYHLFNNADTHPQVPLSVHKFITRLPFYNHLRDMHDIHHGKKDTNFGFIDFQMDKLFGTYTNICPKYLVDIQNELIDLDEKKN
jgi:hypothetical protein